MSQHGQILSARADDRPEPSKLALHIWVSVWNDRNTCESCMSPPLQDGFGWTHCEASLFRGHYQPPRPRTFWKFERAATPPCKGGDTPPLPLRSSLTSTT